MPHGEPRSIGRHGGESGGTGPAKVCPRCRSRFHTRGDTCPEDGAPLMLRDLPEGTVLAGKYRIDAKIGHGGMGIVYRAEHIVMGKAVAVKVISPLLSRDPAFLEMFKTEARLASNFKHDNVLTIHDFGESDGRFYLVMELLQGESLKEMIERRGSLVPERAFNILLQVCDAVSAAHRVGIVHLDLKGENIVVEERPEGDHVTVLDFGLARLTGQESMKFEDGTTVGTVGYMAPEQIMGGTVDERTDVYAIGVMAYECLSGSLPFQGKSKDNILDQQLRGKARKLPRTAVLNIVPRGTKSAIMSAISANPDKRPASVGALAASFQKALEEVSGGTRRLSYGGRAEQSGIEAHALSAVERVRDVFSGIASRLRPSVRGARAARDAAAPDGMVLVPAGEFTMGSNKGRPDEVPVTAVRLAAFYIDITPVTNLQYARFVQATDHRPPSTWKTVSFPPGRGAYPVTGVTWRDAADYAAWAGKRLPTEAEWEKAARGVDGRTYPWGDKWEASYANWGGNPAARGRAEVSLVGTFARDLSPCGCLDMAGNVKEWTASWYKAYGAGYRSDDFGEKFRVVRGGSYMSADRTYLRTSCRSHARPDESGDIGFRCVIEGD